MDIPNKKKKVFFKVPACQVKISSFKIFDYFLMVSEDDMTKKVNIHAEILRKTSLTTHSLNAL